MWNGKYSSVAEYIKKIPGGQNEHMTCINITIRRFKLVEEKGLPLH